MPIADHLTESLRVSVSLLVLFQPILERNDSQVHGESPMGKKKKNKPQELCYNKMDLVANNPLPSLLIQEGFKTISNLYILYLFTSIYTAIAIYYYFLMT